MYREARFFVTNRGSGCRLSRVSGGEKTFSRPNRGTSSCRFGGQRVLATRYGTRGHSVADLIRRRQRGERARETVFRTMRES